MSLLVFSFKIKNKKFKEGKRDKKKNIVKWVIVEKIVFLRKKKVKSFDIDMYFIRRCK